MTWKKIAAAAIAAIIIIIIVFAARKHKQEGYVLDATSKIRFKDADIYLTGRDFNADNVKEYFANDVINPYTLKYFIFLDEKFKDVRSREELLEKVREYLYSVMPSYDEADKLFAVYQTYTDCQLGLHDKMKSWGSPASPEDAIDYLHKLQEYRRDVFGKDDADALYGPSVMAEEYPIRRGMIIGDRNLYGEAKEKRLAQLKKEMWGKDADQADDFLEPLNRYNDKLQMYGRDLGEMKSDDDRRARVREFRREFFSPDQVQKLEEVDNTLAREKSRESDYFDQESKIRNNPSFNDDEKSAKIRELQDQMFGVEADAFRRRLTIEKGE